MKTTDQATPRPWEHLVMVSNYQNQVHEIYARGHIIACISEGDLELANKREKLPAAANAALIVQAVNEYEALQAVAAAVNEFIVNASSLTAKLRLLSTVEALAKLREGKAVE